MAETEKFDAIVVGAGPAGTTAAYIMAQSGMEVLLLERGLYPGAKNVFGGILYTPVLNRIMPEFWKDAPVERHVKGIRIFLISEKNAVSIGVESQEHNQPPYNNSFTVSRPRFDNWYAQQAQDGLVACTQRRAKLLPHLGHGPEVKRHAARFPAGQRLLHPLPRREGGLLRPPVVTLQVGSQIGRIGQSLGDGLGQLRHCFS